MRLLEVNALFITNNATLPANLMSVNLIRQKLFLLLVLAAVGTTGCVSIPKGPLKGGEKIVIGPGTEDMILDDFGGQKRVLISCDDRRHGNRPSFSGICSYDPETRRIDTLKIKEYPHGMAFRPHGIDLQQIGQRLHLFVVCHDDSAGHHWVADFQVDGNDLLWVQNYQAGMLTSPNEVCAMPNGDLYVTNDHLKRGDLAESFFKKKVAEIIHFRPDASHQVAYKGIAYGNGITQRNGYVFVAATVENALYRFKVNSDGTLVEKTKIAKVKGPDNLRWDGEDLLVACHLRLVKFLAHAKNAEKRSPTTVYRIQPGKLKPIPVYGDKGKTISGGSTALMLKDRLLVSQVFENWIVEVKK
jgi:arylesterase/paraoxonase